MHITCKNKTPGYKGYAVKFSPFHKNLLATAGAANFGLVGNGQLGIHSLPTPQLQQLQKIKGFDTQYGLFDVAWSECHESQLVSGDYKGNIILFDINIQDSFPIARWKEHQREVMALKWNYISKNTFLSCSWDSTIKLWSPGHKSSLMTFLGHEQNSCVYDISFSPKNPNMFASCGGDKTIRFWDAALPPSSSNTLTLANSGHRDQILSIDHNKYQQTMIATASTDKTIMLWDLANPTRPIIQLGPFDFPVRKLEFSPFHKQLLAVCGYDMRVSIWDIDKMRIVYQSSDATEFVFGINWSLFQPGLLASHSWDESVTCYQL